MAYADLVLAADRAAQGNLGGETVTYRPATVDSVDILGIFDENFVLLDDGNPAAEQVTPVVWLRLDDLPLDPDEDEPLVTIRGVDYTVRERQRDSIGGIRLYLHKVS